MVSLLDLEARLGVKQSTGMCFCNKLGICQCRVQVAKSFPFSVLQELIQCAFTEMIQKTKGVASVACFLYFVCFYVEGNSPGAHSNDIESTC